MWRIVYIGNFSRDWTTETHLARDARRLGHQVVEVAEPRTPVEWGPFRDQVLAHAADADLLLYTKTYGLGAAGPALWRRVEEAGCETASFHLDLYRGLRRQTEIGDDPMWETRTVFTADGDPGFGDWCAERGIRHRWSPPAVVSDECIPVEQAGWPLPELTAGPRVIFVGSTGRYHPEWGWRPRLLELLHARFGRDFKTYGQPPVRGFALNALYQTPGRVVVGDSLMLPGRRNYFSDRYFETVGRGGFLIAPRAPGLDAFLEDGVHYVGYDVGDPTGLIETIEDWLDRPDDARAIAEAGRLHVRSHHTYQHRFARMLLELPDPPIEQPVLL